MKFARSNYSKFRVSSVQGSTAKLSRSSHPDFSQVSHSRAGWPRVKFLKFPEFKCPRFKGSIFKGRGQNAQGRFFKVQVLKLQGFIFGICMVLMSQVQGFKCSGFNCKAVPKLAPGLRTGAPFSGRAAPGNFFEVCKVKMSQVQGFKFKG